MRLAFGDIKKTISRRGGEPRLIPYFLPLPDTSGKALSRHRPSSTAHPARELDALIALYESYLGRTRSTWPEDRAAVLIGDYRLARCLENVLSEWYVWQSPAWPETGPDAAALAAHDIATPSQLRLALYDFVAESYGGYLPSQEREAALDAFAAALGIPRPSLDDLLDLDSDARALLARLTPEPPTAAQLTTRYNQRALEAVLTNASHVEWLLTPELAAATGEPLGALVKRICFLARRMGVQYDVAYADANVAYTDSDAATDTTPLPLVAERRPPYLTSVDHDIPAESATASGSPLPVGDGTGVRFNIPAESATAPTGLAAGLQPANPHPAIPLPSLASASPAAPLSSQGEGLGVRFPGLGVRSLLITLYGPQEMTGAPIQYGERLARLCRALLGYRRAAEKPGRATLAGPGLTGSARVYLHGRPLTFDLDARFLALIGSVSDATGQNHADIPEIADPQFDSFLEQRLHEQFAALERDGEAHGWRLEREPEPILAGTTILVPDFALTRGAQRVYLEIAGYWRPEYRERKARKLTAVRGRVALALAAPVSARSEFTALERDFPILWYKDTVSAENLLSLLDRAYNDLEVRLARLDLAAIVAEVTARGHIPPLESMALLRAYSRGELARALDLLQTHARNTGEPPPEWLDGIGLCAPAWLARLVGDLRQTVADAQDQRLPLSALVAALPALLAGYPNPNVTESAVEALARRARLHVARDSIFHAVVSVDEAPAQAAPRTTTHPKAPAAQPRRRPRRTTTRTDSYTTQSIFPPEQPGPDNPEPDIPTRAP